MIVPGLLYIMDSLKMSSSLLSTNNDIIVSLLNNPFSKRDDGEKDEIIKSGRPKPVLNLLKIYKDHGRSFQPVWYQQHKWLCGSENKTKLFCWPCLLMSTKRRSPWVADGFDDLKNFSRTAARHIYSKDHLNAYISLNKLAKRVVKKSELLLKLSRIENVKYNELIKKNREIVKVMIDVTSLICKQQIPQKIPFKRYEKLTESLKSSNFKAIFDLVIKRNPEVKQHWEKTEYFRNVNAKIQNELIECFHDEIQKAIGSQIKQADFFACTVEGTGSASGNIEVSVVVRLVDPYGKVQEYFLGFHEIDRHRTAQGLIGLLCKVLEQFNMKQKLVALAYDGRCVASSELNYFQTKIKEIVPQAIFPHSYSHNINLILQQSCSTIKPAKEFFATLQGIPGFFHNSPKRKAVLNTVLLKNFPTSGEAFWEASFSVICAVHTNRVALIECFRLLVELSSDAVTVRESVCYINSLKEFTFVFLLALFHHIFEKTGALFTAFKNISNDTKMCINAVMECTFHVRKQRNDKTCEAFIQATESRIGSKLSDDHDPDFYKQLYFEVLDNIITQLEFKYSSCKNLSFLRLGNITQFPKYEKEFPSDALTSFWAPYGELFNLEKLKAELETVFSSDHKDEFRSPSLQQLIERMVVDDVTDILPEAFKLFSLIATIPVSPPYSSCLPRIKSFVRNTVMTLDRSDAFTYVAIEKDTLERLELCPSWYDDVIERFAQKKRPVELLYRPIPDTGCKEVMVSGKTCCYIVLIIRNVCIVSECGGSCAHMCCLHVRLPHV